MGDWQGAIAALSYQSLVPSGGFEVRELQRLLLRVLALAGVWTHASVAQDAAGARFISVTFARDG